MEWRRKWQSTPVLLPGKSHGRRNLVGYSPRGGEKSDITKWLYFHFSLLCIGEGNGNPLQYSCLENPRDSGIPEDPGGLPSLGLHRVRHDWSDLAAAAEAWKHKGFNNYTLVLSKYAEILAQFASLGWPLIQFAISVKALHDSVWLHSINTFYTPTLWQRAL